MRIIGVDEFKRIVGSDVTTDDAWILDRIQRLSDEFEKRLNRKLEEATATELHFGGTDQIWVRRPPIDSGQSITVIDDTFTIKNTDLDFDYEEGRIIYKDLRFVRRNYRSVSITYTGGYANDTAGIIQVPGTLKRALEMQLRYEYANRDHLGLNSVGISGASVSLAPAELLKEVRQILDQEKRWTIA